MGVSEGLRVGVFVGVAVGVYVGVNTGVSVGVDVDVSVGCSVDVLVGVTVGVCVRANVAVAVGVWVGAGSTAVGVVVDVSDGVAVAVRVGVEVYFFSGAIAAAALTSPAVAEGDGKTGGRAVNVIVGPGISVLAGVAAGDGPEVADGGTALVALGVDDGTTVVSNVGEAAIVGVHTTGAVAPAVAVEERPGVTIVGTAVDVD